jgi:hypothetical protein
VQVAIAAKCRNRRGHGEHDGLDRRDDGRTGGSGASIPTLVSVNLQNVLNNLSTPARR